MNNGLAPGLIVRVPLSHRQVDGDQQQQYDFHAEGVECPLFTEGEFLYCWVTYSSVLSKNTEDTVG